MKSRISYQGAAVAALMLAGSSMAAFAQADGAPGSAPQDDGGLQDIIVTAQRTETNLQKTPIAVTALNPQALQERGVVSVLDLNAIAPNVSIGTRSGGGTASGAITIRGIGIDANPPASPAVGIYVDDVYLPASWGNLIGIFDVNRIEVLRGPQGTLFGRNTISGAIQYVGIKPELGKTSGYLQGTLGNLDRRDIAGAINLPLGSIAALRVSGAVSDRDGYVYDRRNDVNRGSDNTKQLRAQLRISPSDGLTIDLKGEYLRQASNGRATIATDFNYASVLGRPYGPGGPFGPAGLDAFKSTGFYEIAGYDAPEFFKATFKVAQGVVAYDLNEDITLKSITAYSESRARLMVDQDGAPVPIISVSRGVITDKLFTQELQLTGKSFDDRLTWTGGVYYYDAKNTTIGQASVIFGGAPSDPFGDYKIRTRSFALYGQATFDITDSVAVVGGLRYTNERVKADDVGLPGAPLSASRRFTDTSPMLGLNWQATNDILFYVKGSRGFRAGGYAPTIAVLNYYGPEKATTYEAGARMEFLDRRLRINPTIFRTDWKNIQFNQIILIPAIFPGPLPIINNAGNARLTGAEVEIQAAVTQRLSFTASGALLDGDYTFIAPALAGRLQLNSDLKRAPKSSFTLGSRYNLPLAGGSRLTFSANYAWQARQRSATTDVDFIAIPAYGLLSSRIEYAAPDDRWSIALFGTNLTDRKYIVGGTNYGRGGTIPTVSVDVGRPQEYGVTARFNF